MDGLGEGVSLTDPVSEGEKDTRVGREDVEGEMDMVRLGEAVPLTEALMEGEPEPEPEPDPESLLLGESPVKIRRRFTRRCC